MGNFFSWANVHKSWFTTLIGVLIITASVASVFTHARSWTEASVGITIGLGLMGAKDPKLPSGEAMGVVGGAALLLFLLASGGCASQKQYQAKYGTLNAPVTVAVSDTLKLPITVTTKADSLSAGFDLDSLAAAAPGDTLKLQSVGGQATLKVWKSPATKPGGGQRLNARFDVPPQVIHDTIVKTVTLYAKCPPTWTMAPKVKPTRWQRYYGHYQDFSVCVVSIALVVLLIVLGWKLKPWRLLRFAPVLVVLAGAGTLGGCQAAKPAPKPKSQSSQSYGLPYWIKRDLHRNI